MSYVEAAEQVAQTTSPAVTYHFVDEAGVEVCLTFTGTDFAMRHATSQNMMPAQAQGQSKFPRSYQS